MTVDVTTLALAVDSTQVNTASVALDKMAAAGTRAEGAATRLKPAVDAQGRALAASGQAASKTALSFKTLEEAQAALGPKAAAALAKVAGDLGTTQAKADAAAASLRKMGDDAAQAGQKANAALATAAGGAGGRPPAPPTITPPPLPPSPPPLPPGSSSGAASSGAASTASLGAAAEKAAAGTERLRQAEQALALADARVASSQAVLTAAVARNAQAQQQLAAVNGNAAASQEQIAQAQARAASANAAMLSAQAGLVANQQAAAKASAAHQAALAGLGKQAGLTAFQSQQLGFQLHDFAVQVISGQNPLTAFVQQGSQLSGTFGGAGNAFRAVLSLLTPMRIAMGAAAAGAIALGLAMADAESKARDLAAIQAQLAGTGRSDLFSTKELREFISQLAQVPGVSHDAATAIVSELSKSHEISAGLFKDLARIAADYAKATGQDIPSATKELARAFADPVQGAKTFEQTLNGPFRAAQINAINDAVRLGDTMGAQAVMFGVVEGRVQGAVARGFTPLGTAIDDLSKAWGRAQQGLSQSDGLRNMNALLAKTIEGIAWLIDNIPKIPKIPVVGPILSGGASAGLNLIPGAAAVSAAAKLAGAVSPTTEEQRTSGGKVTDQTAGAGGSVARASIATKTALDDEIKSVQKVTEGYKGQKEQIAELVDLRKRLTADIKKATEEKQPASVVDDLKGRLAGVNERITSIGKRGANGEGQQVLDAQLAGSIKAARDGLQNERDEISFQQRFLQGMYQAGQVSLVDFYEKKRQAIAQGTTAEIAELEKERAAVQAHLAKTTDPSKKQQDRERLGDIDREEERLRKNADRETQLANQEQAASFKQLTDQVLNYRANLLQLQGDEEGAAKLRAQIAINQARDLAAQTSKSGIAISPAELAANEKLIEQTNQIDAAKKRLSATDSMLAIDEERITFLQSTGAIGELEALSRLGAARATRLAELQKEVETLEDQAKQRPLDLQLKLDASRARLELEKLQASLDPLKDKFDGIFKDAGANLFSDLMNGTKPRDAIRNFANSLSRQINDVVGKQLSQQLFGNGGGLGGVGSFFADLFGGKNRGGQAAPAITNTAQEAFRLSEISAENASGAAGAASIASQAAATTAATAATTAQTAAMSAETAASSAATAALTALAAAAQSAAASLASMSASGGAGGLGSLFSGGSGFGTGSDFGNQDYGQFFAAGGFTGDVDPKKAAGIVHGKEFVFSAPAVRSIGRGTLEELHDKAQRGEQDALMSTIHYVAGARELGGPVSSDSLYRVNERGPELLSIAGRDYLMTGNQGGEVKSAPSGPSEPSQTFHMHMTFPPGTNRATATQMGAAAVRGGMDAARRNGKRV
jgi:hypothetical protein